MMRMSDIDLIYNYNPVVYVNIKNFKFRVSSDTLYYLHIPKVYSGERLGYVICAVCQKHTFILSYMDGEPYVIESSEDIHGMVKDTLYIKYDTYYYADDGNVIVYDTEHGGYMTLDKVLKLQDDYFRGYFDGRIKSYQALSTPIIEEESKTPINYDRYVTILLVIILGVSIFQDIY